jgi:hypothetical protein
LGGQNAEKIMTIPELASQMRSYMSLPVFLAAARQKQKRVYSPAQLHRMTDEKVIAIAISGGGRSINTVKAAQELAEKSKDLREWIQLLAAYEQEDVMEDSMESMLETSAQRGDARSPRSRRE